MIDLTALKERVGNLQKLLGTLALLCLAAVGWTFYNIYQPMKDLERDSAVQTTILEQIRDDIASIDTKLENENGRSEDSD